MYAGAFAGFATAWATGSPLLGLAAAIVVGLGAGAIMALLTVTSAPTSTSRASV